MNTCNLCEKELKEGEGQIMIEKAEDYWLCPSCFKKIGIPILNTILNQNTMKGLDKLTLDMIFTLNSIALEMITQKEEELGEELTGYEEQKKKIEQITQMNEYNEWKKQKEEDAEKNN